MKLKLLIVNILLLGCVFATITGVFNYAKNRIYLRREKVRIAAQGFETEGAIEALRTEMIKWAALATAGASGLFIFIYRSTRQKQQTKQLYKSRQL